MVVGFGGKQVIMADNDLSYYGRIMVRALVKEFPNNYYILYTPENIKKTSKKLMTVLNNESVRVKFPRAHVNFKEGWYKGHGILNSAKGHGINVFHGIDEQLPSGFKHYTNIPCVVTLTDPLFKQYGWLEAFSRHHRAKKAVAMAKRVITISEVAKQQVIDNYKVNPDSVEVVYPCYHETCDEAVPENMYDIIREKYHLPEKFILYKGRMESEDDVEDAVKLLHELDDRKISLVMLGYRTDHFDKQIRDCAHALHLYHRFKQIDKVHHTDLTAVVKMSQAVVMPNTSRPRDLYKLINAQRCGAVVLCRDSEQAREYGGDGCIYFNTPDDGAEQLNSLLATDGARQHLTDIALANSERFSSAKVAERMMHIYRSMLMHRRLYK